MSKVFDNIKVGDKITVPRFKHTGIVFKVENDKVYSMNERNIVCVVTRRDYIKIIDKISMFAKMVMDIIFFFIKRPKI